MNKEDVVYINIHTHTHKKEFYSATKRWNIAICYDMDGPRVYYAKRNKSDWERQILYNFSYM